VTVNIEDYVKKKKPKPVELRFGVEIECGVSNRPSLPGGWTHSDDGSIHTSLDSMEIKTVGPYSSNFDSFVHDLQAILDSIERKVVNDSCGFHVHISFDDRYYHQLLCSWNFYNYFMKRYDKTFPGYKFQDRKHKDYCKAFANYENFVGAVSHQVAVHDRDSCRYFAINHCYTYHGTIEFRIFPGSVSVPEIKRMLKFLFDVINEYIHLDKYNNDTYTLDRGDL